MSSNSQFNGDGATSHGRMLSDRAREVIGRLGGDADTLPVPVDTTPEGNPPDTINNHTDHVDKAPSANTSQPDSNLPNPGEDDLNEAPPEWLELFLSGDLEVEALADRLAQTIREDPRFMRMAWWQRLRYRLAACVPDHLISMANRLVVARKRLEQMSPYGADD